MLRIKKSKPPFEGGMDFPNRALIVALFPYAMMTSIVDAL